MLKIKINKRQYQVRGFLGLIATILSIPAIAVGIIGGFIIVAVCFVLLIPSVIVGMPTARRLPQEDG